MRKSEAVAHYERAIQTAFREVADAQKFEKLTVAEGDKVLFGKYSGSDIKVEGKEFKIMKESEITVDYGPGETIPVKLFDGSTILLKKLDAEYDLTSRPAALAYLEKMRAKGLVVTGLLFIDENLPELHDISGTARTPLKDMDCAELNPGSAALEELQRSMK